MRELRIKENEAGQRLDKFLAKYMKEAPKSFFYKMLRKKNIVLNGKKATGNEKLAVDDQIKLFLAEETIEKFMEDKTLTLTNTSLDIIYEDKDVAFINKPVGMLSQKAKESDESVVEHFLSYLIRSNQLTKEQMQTFKPSICNRLDRNTSGLIVAGKSLVGLQKMNELFKERGLEKYYLCIVNGVVTENQHISGYLKKEEKTNAVEIRTTEFPDAVFIETAYKPLKSSHGLTLLEVHLITGKTHQIRAHLASIGHPLLGDYKYGNRKENEKWKNEYGLSSQLLHSYRLVFPKEMSSLHQLEGKEFMAPLPEQFQKIGKDCGLV